jgi:hypothetical protein
MALVVGVERQLTAFHEDLRLIDESGRDQHLAFPPVRPRRSFLRMNAAYLVVLMISIGNRSSSGGKSLCCAASSKIANAVARYL